MTPPSLPSPLLGAVPGLLITMALVLAVAAVVPATGAGRVDEADRIGPRAGARVRRVLARVPRGRAVLAAVGAVAAWAGTGWPVLAVAAALAVLAVPEVLAHRTAAQGIARLDALAAFTRRVADVLASGAGGLEHAIAAVARSAPEPIAPAVVALAARIGTRGLEPALRVFADELDDPAADEVVAALILRSRAGGRGLLDVLEAQATALAAEAAARRDVEADRAKPRTDTRLVVAITAAMVTALVVFAGPFLDPYDRPLGQIVLAAVTALVALALRWMHTLAREHRPPRLLTNPASPEPHARRAEHQSRGGELR